MIKKLTTWFSEAVEETEESGVDSNELGLATAALMMEVARADFDRSAEEQVLMLKQLAARLNLTETAANGLLALAQDASDEAHDLYSFTSIINDRYGYQDKKQLMVDLWEVALADQHIDPQEDHIIRRISGLLSIDHSDLMHARAIARD
ncbi:MAG: TerB family tellurite resistance protein [Proteobacteria bacterium]|jgi:uncharacterized tellurite resistance protein B-like protein|nr:TerB family tellurite resistance protein [Pseudomonadota bacterium]MDA0958087.1 TerB family tellurite resistance protein [Pseudomonadota bacterium]MDA1206990.1 TerB family tellurite resistance protein [Pseudomonadota bacterium]